MGLMKQEITLNRESQGEQFQDALGVWKEKKQKQGQELEKRRSLVSDQIVSEYEPVEESSMILEATPLQGSHLQSKQTKEIIAEVEVSSDEEDQITEGFHSQMERLGDGDQFEDEDEVRIKEVAERLKKNQIK